MGKRRCLYCNEVIIGRPDKKFCSDSCRNHYNYKKSFYSRPAILNVHKKIRKNHRILTELCQKNYIEIPLSVLESLKFDFTILTGFEEGPPARFKLYNFEYEKAEKGIIKVYKY